MTMTLYCFGESGHSYKVALALELLGLQWRPRKVDFFNGETRTPEYRALNPFGEAPILVEGDLVLSQSGVILDYLSERTGKLGGGTPEARREILRWVLFDNHKLSSQCGTLRYLMNFMPEDKRQQDVIDFLTGRVRAALAVLDAGLEGREFLVGDEPTQADLSNCSYLFYPEPFAFERVEWKNIDRWLSNIEQLPGWQHPYDLMPGRPSDRGL